MVCVANHGTYSKRHCKSLHKKGKWDELEHYHDGWAIFGNVDCIWK
jgi:hypothetical protein